MVRVTVRIRVESITVDVLMNAILSDMPIFTLYSVLFSDYVQAVSLKMTFPILRKSVYPSPPGLNVPFLL